MPYQTGPVDARRDIIFTVFALAFIILFIYWPVQSYDFINYDDQEYVSSNSRIQSGFTLKNIIDTFKDIHTSNWHPFTMMSHMLDWRLFGIKAGGHHWTSVIIHIVSTILLFLLFNKMTGAVWRSAFVAALFAVHPLNVESVAWIAERKNVLSTFFWILTLLCYTRYIERPDWKRYLPVLSCFALGLMSKSMLVTLPFVLLLLDYWPLNRMDINIRHRKTEGETPLSTKKSNISFLILEKIPLLILSFISVCLTLYAAGYMKSVVSLKSLSMTERISNACVSYFLYIKKLFWPDYFSFFYPLSNLFKWQIFSAILFLVIVTVFVLKYFRRYPYLLTGWLWYLGTLIPVIGIVQVGKQAMADRYAYVPLIGIFVMTGWLVPDLLKNVPRRKLILNISALAILTTLIFISSLQVGYWRDDYSLSRHALNVTKRNYKANHVMGMAYLGRNDMTKAVFYLTESLKIREDNRARNDLGSVLMKQGKLDEAEAQFRQAITDNPDSAQAHNNLGAVLATRGKLSEAIPEFKRALEINPFYKEAFDNLSNAQDELNRAGQGEKNH